MIRFRVLFNEERILLTSPEMLREVLVTRSYDFIKPSPAEYIFGKILGKGLLVAEGSNHKVRMLSNLIKARKDKNLLSHFDRTSENP